MRDSTDREGWYAEHFRKRLAERGMPNPYRCRVCGCRIRVVMCTRVRSPLGHERVQNTCNGPYCLSRAQSVAFQPIDQDRFGPGRGNCFSACVAMMLELQLADVPWFMGADPWWPPFVEWCAGRGYKPLYYLASPDWHPPEFAIAGGPCDRNGSGHACLAYNGRIVHDPSFYRTGLTLIEDWITFERIPTETT